MTWIHIDFEAAKHYLGRNYDLEWEFIKEMDKMSEMNFDQTLLVIDCDPKLVGENWIIVYEAQNDNALGIV